MANQDHNKTTRDVVHTRIPALSTGCTFLLPLLIGLIRHLHLFSTCDWQGCELFGFGLATASYKISVNWCEYTVLQCRDAETLELELHNKHGTLTKLRMSIIKQIDKNVYTKMLLIFSSIECQHPF